MSPNTMRSCLRSVCSQRIFVQITKSREAYETQQVAFLYRPSSNTYRRSRPQSVGGGWKDGRDRSNSSGKVKDNNFPSPLQYQPLDTKPSSPGRGEGVNCNGRGRRAYFDHPGPPFIPPPPFSRRVDRGMMTAVVVDGGNRGSTRMGKPRTRVRPSSANARVSGRPAAGQGVGGGKVGSCSTVLRKVHIARQVADSGPGIKDDTMATARGNSGKVGPYRALEHVLDVHAFQVIHSAWAMYW